MSDEAEAEEDRVYVTLRVYHDDLDADHVGALLGLTPNTLHRRGHPYREAGKLLAPTGAWFFDSKDAVASKDLGEHLGWLFDRLKGKDEAIGQLRAEGYQVEVSCYWLHFEPDRYLVLTPVIMGRLVELGLKFWVDAY